MKRLFVAACLTGLLATSVSVDAAVVLDQDALVRPAPGALGTQIVSAGRRVIAGTLRELRYVQTATAGLNGLLSSIELQGYRNGLNPPADTLRLTLIDGDYAAGARSVIGSRELNAALGPTSQQSRDLQSFVTFDTTGFGYRVASGQAFSILIELRPVNQTGTFNFTTANSFGQVQQPDGTFRFVTEGANYTRGGLFQLASNGAPLAVQHDVGFRSFVDTAGAVPEPSTWAMLILGFAAIGAAARRRPTLATA
jgi:hypothetical protein